MSKTPKRLPDPPSGDNVTIKDITEYLNNLVRELSESQKKNISGPINSTPFIPSNYTDTRKLDASAATLQNVKDLVATLLQILKDGGLLR